MTRSKQSILKRSKNSNGIIELKIGVKSEPKFVDASKDTLDQSSTSDDKDVPRDNIKLGFTKEEFEKKGLNKNHQHGFLFMTMCRGIYEYFSFDDDTIKCSDELFKELDNMESEKRYYILSIINHHCGEHENTTFEDDTYDEYDKEYYDLISKLRFIANGGEDVSDDDDEKLWSDFGKWDYINFEHVGLRDGSVYTFKNMHRLSVSIENDI